MVSAKRVRRAVRPASTAGKTAANAGPSAAPADGPTRERLLQAGLKLARKCGLRALTVRAVAAEAKVNLGSFVYHFGTRDAFIAELISHWYAPLMSQVEFAAAAADLPGQITLRELVLGIGDWMIQERRFVGHLVMDAASGETAARRFLRDSAKLPPALVQQAIEQAQAAGQICAADSRQILLLIFGCIGLPILLFESLAGAKILPRDYAAPFETFTFERPYVEQRLDWVLRGLAPALPEKASVKARA